MANWCWLLYMYIYIYICVCVCILVDSSGKLTLSSGKSLNIISKSAISHISMLHSLIGSSGHQISSIYPPVSSNMARWQNDFLIQTLKVWRIFMDFPATFDDTPGYPLGPIGIIQKKNPEPPDSRCKAARRQWSVRRVHWGRQHGEQSRDESGWNTPGTVLFLKHALGFVVWWLFFYIDLYILICSLMFVGNKAFEYIWMM